MIRYSFRGKIWRYKEVGWHFVSLPITMSRKIRKKHGSEEEGWGRLKAFAELGQSKWDTAIWFDSKRGTYLLPIKTTIRRAEGLSEKMTVSATVVLAKVNPKLARFERGLR